MKKIILPLLLAVLLFSCDTAAVEVTPSGTLTISYNGNGSSGGSVPVDSNKYTSGDSAVVCGNYNNLVKEGADFLGWNTRQDGQGTSYNPGDPMEVSQSIQLYAEWDNQPLYTLSFNSNGASSGTVPSAVNDLVAGQLVELKAPVGLDKAGFDFVGWNTHMDPTKGINYPVGTHFPMAAQNTTLYATWYEYSEVLVMNYTSDVQGTVVNVLNDASVSTYWNDAASGKTLVGSTISFYPLDSGGTYSSTAEATAVVNSSGNYLIEGLPMGNYKVTGEMNGWHFSPRYIDTFGSDYAMPALMAYPNQGNDVIVIMLSWEDTSLDLDGLLTYYNGTARDYVGYLSNTSSAASSFSSYGSKNTSPADCSIELVRDVQATADPSIPRVEAITIDYNAAAPFLDAVGTSSGIANDTLMYYINCYTSGSTITGIDTSGPDAEPFHRVQVDILYTDFDGATDHYGGFPVPWNTSEPSMAMLYIKCSINGGYTIGSASSIDPSTASLAIR